MFPLGVSEKKPSHVAEWEVLMSMHHLPLVPSVRVLVLPAMLLHRSGGDGGGACVPQRHSVPNWLFDVAQSVVDAKFVLKKVASLTDPGM